MFRKKFLVIGDSCLDIFKYCESCRLAPDFPVPILNELRETTNGGMALNTYNNIKSLGQECDIVTNDNWKTVTKTRFVHSSSNHTFFRVDSSCKIPRIDLDLINYNYEIIIISDYDKGFLSESDIEVILSHHDCVFIDTKKLLGRWVEKSKFIKINFEEFNNSKDFIFKNTDIYKKIIKTAGPKGCYFQDKNYPVEETRVHDISGAGDSFLAAMASEYIKSKDIRKSIKFANRCASEVVKFRGVTLIK